MIILCNTAAPRERCFLYFYPGKNRCVRIEHYRHHLQRLFLPRPAYEGRKDEEPTGGSGNVHAGRFSGVSFPQEPAVHRLWQAASLPVWMRAVSTRLPPVAACGLPTRLRGGASLLTGIHAHLIVWQARIAGRELIPMPRIARYAMASKVKETLQTVLDRIETLQTPRRKGRKPPRLLYPEDHCHRK